MEPATRSACHASQQHQCRGVRLGNVVPHWRIDHATAVPETDADDRILIGQRVVIPARTERGRASAGLDQVKRTIRPGSCDIAIGAARCDNCRGGGRRRVPRTEIVPGDRP